MKQKYSNSEQALKPCTFTCQMAATLASVNPLCKGAKHYKIKEWKCHKGKLNIGRITPVPR